MVTVSKRSKSKSKSKGRSKSKKIMHGGSEKWTEMYNFCMQNKNIKECADFVKNADKKRKDWEEKRLDSTSSSSKKDKKKNREESREPEYHKSAVGEANERKIEKSNREVKRLNTIKSEITGLEINSVNAEVIMKHAKKYVDDDVIQEINDLREEMQKNNNRIIELFKLQDSKDEKIIKSRVLMDIKDTRDDNKDLEEELNNKLKIIKKTVISNVEEEIKKIDKQQTALRNPQLKLQGRSKSKSKSKKSKSKKTKSRSAKSKSKKVRKH